MNKKRILTVVLFISCIIVNARAFSPNNDDLKKENEAKEVKEELTTTWEFYSIIRQPSAEELADESDYKFGQEAGFLYTRFLDYYVVRETIAPGDPTKRTVIRKPAIYNAVRSVEKQLEKDVKNNTLTKDQATAEFTHILKIAISAIDSESQSFEKVLQAHRKNVKNILSAFKSVKLIEI